MEIKKLTREDVDLLTEVSALFWDEKGSKEQLQLYLGSPTNHAYVALIESKVCGFAFGYSLTTFYSKPMFYLHAIDVSPDYQRRGIATKLMNAIIDECKKNGYRKCFLVTNKHNIAATTLYETSGGQAVNDDDVVYEWNLS